MNELITIEHLEKSFYTPAGEIKVLKGVDAAFLKGEMVSIVGASGVGKSTFLHILGTLDRPTAGSVIYSADGAVNPFALSNGEIALFRNRVIGFVFQFHYLLPEFSALENVMMPGLLQARAHTAAGFDYAHIKQRAEMLLDELGLHARRDHKPGQLSGGEQQRVAVARALLPEPKVVLADEPTGNLDTTTGEELFKLLLKINEERGVTFIVVTHNESLSKRCHRVFEMVDGFLHRKQ